MAFNRPTLGQLIKTAEAQINALVPGADARLRFSMLNVFARVWAALADGLYSALVFLSRQLFAVTATRVFLERIAQSYGISRLSAAAAQGCVDLTGAPNTPVPVGTVFQRADGLQYQLTAGIVLPASGVAQLPAIALTTGVIGNAAAGVKLQPVSTIAGLTGAVVCDDEIAGGADDELDEALRARLLDRLRNPPGAGTVADWRRWAFSLSAAVTRVWVVPLAYGPSTVAVVFALDGQGIVPPASVIAQMKTHLAQFTPAGSMLTVFAPTLRPVDFSINEIPSSDPGVRQNILAELSDLLYREGGPGSTIPLTHFAEAISSAQGEYDHVLHMPSGAITLRSAAPTFEVGVLGTVSWP